MSQFASGDELRETGTAGVYTLGRYTDLSLYVIILGELEGKDYAAYRAISARPQKEDLKEVLLAYTEKRVPLGTLFRTSMRQDLNF